MKKIILLIIVLLLIVLAAFGLYLSNKKEPNTKPLFVSENNELKTYQNEELGFEFQYPSNVELKINDSVGLNLKKERVRIFNITYCDNPSCVPATLLQIKNTDAKSVDEIDYNYNIGKSIPILKKNKSLLMEEKLLKLSPNIMINPTNGIISIASFILYIVVIYILSAILAISESGLKKHQPKINIEKFFFSPFIL